MGVEKKVEISDDAENAAHAMAALCIPFLGPLMCLFSCATGKKLHPNGEHREQLLYEATKGNDDKMFNEFLRNRRSSETGCEVSQSIDLSEYHGPYHGGIFSGLNGPIKKTTTYKIR